MFENSGVYGLERFEQAQRERLRQEALTENRRSRRGDHDFDVQVPGKPRATVRFKRESFVDLNENVRVALRTLSRSMDVNQKADDKDEGSPLILRMAA